MAFLLIVPSLAIGCKWVFSLTAMWMHPQQACLPTLGEEAQKLMLLADKAQTGHMPMHGWMMPWPTCLCLVRDTLALWLMAYPVWMPVVAWTNCRCWSYCNAGARWVCPEGLNGGLKALLFDSKELPIWNMATVDESTWDLPLIEVDLSSAEPKATNSTPVPPLFPAIEPPCHIATAFNVTSRRPWNGCSRLPPQPASPVSQHSMPGRKPPSVAFGALPSTRAADSLSLEGTDSAIPDLMATSSQGVPMCGHARKHP